MVRLNSSDLARAALIGTRDAANRLNLQRAAELQEDDLPALYRGQSDTGPIIQRLGQPPTPISANNASGGIPLGQAVPTLKGASSIDWMPAPALPEEPISRKLPQEKLVGVAIWHRVSDWTFSFYDDIDYDTYDVYIGGLEGTDPLLVESGIEEGVFGISNGDTIEREHTFVVSDLPNRSFLIEHIEYATLRPVGGGSAVPDYVNYSKSQVPRDLDSVTLIEELQFTANTDNNYSVSVAPYSWRWEGIKARISEFLDEPRSTGVGAFAPPACTYQSALSPSTNHYDYPDNELIVYAESLDTALITLQKKKLKMRIDPIKFEDTDQCNLVNSEKRIEVDTVVYFPQISEEGWNEPAFSGFFETGTGGGPPIIQFFSGPLYELRGITPIRRKRIKR